MPEDDGRLRHDAGLALAKLWGVDQGVRRGPKPKLTLDIIVDAALHIAREDGLAVLSMAGVAEAGGCSKMALYRHVSDRDDLLAAMLDTAIGDPPAIDGTWRERFTILWDALQSLYARDTWLLDLPSDIDTLTPRNAAWIDTGLHLFDTSALPRPERLGAVHLITENARFVARRQTTNPSPVDELDRLLSTAASTGARLPRERFPNLAALAASGRSPQPVTLPEARVRDMMMRAIAPYFPAETA